MRALYCGTHQVGLAGPVLKHCNPADLTGLRTSDKDWPGEEGRKGWDAECIAGHFNIFR